MENVAEALKMAFGIMVFVIALTLSISTFSNATSAINNITTYRDKTQSYVYVTQANITDGNSNRIVGVETIIPTMFKAYTENFKIIFLDSDGSELFLYYKTNSSSKNTGILNGETLSVYPIATDENGPIMINYIDLEEEVLGGVDAAIEHLNFLLEGGTYYSKTGDEQKYHFRYQHQILHEEGLYDFLDQYEFVEILGEYYQEDADRGYEIPTSEVAEINKTKKRVITYQVYRTK